jgi:hypothetical protein
MISFKYGTGIRSTGTKRLLVFSAEFLLRVSLHEFRKFGPA